jgi:6-pyruvoyltetrahydropterin/6-carboxytetrahydropterin synthase
MQVHTEVTISAAHHLPNYHGPCKNLHGHSFKIEVDVSGEVDKKTGMVVDFRVIKDIINELDHGYINDTIKNPTAENIVSYLLSQLNKKVPNTFIEVKVWESATSNACDNNY